MTEAEWLRARTTLEKMAEFLAECGQFGERKQLLLLTALARRVWRLMVTEGSRAGVEYAEDVADDSRGIWPDHLHCRAPEDAVYEVPEGLSAYWAARVAERVWQVACHGGEDSNSQTVGEVSDSILVARRVEKTGKPVTSKSDAFRDLRLTASYGYVWPTPLQRELAAHCDIVREIFGNPFRSPSFFPEWRTDTAVTLARQMYDSREFSAIPILADALQDAGCDSADILEHCRGAGPHVRGCWVVDLVLGKE